MGLASDKITALKNAPTTAYVDSAAAAVQTNVDNIVTTATGTILTFSTASVPAGFLECDGLAVSRTTYSDLFAVIADTYGVGDGSTTFNLPDLRGEFIRGFDNGRSIDSGRTIASSQTDTTAKNGLGGSAASAGSHSHTSHVGDGSGSGTLSAIFYRLSATVYPTSTAGDHSHTVTITGDAETRPRNIAMMFCIKT